MAATSLGVRARARSLLLACLGTGALAAFLLTVSPACERKGSEGPPPVDTTSLVSSAGSFTRKDLLGSLAACVGGGYAASARSAQGLAAAVRAYETDRGDATRTAARTAFAAAMRDLERIEVMQIGPLAARSAPGGEGVRDAVYAWPNVSRCLVDEALVAKSYEAPDFPAKALVTVRGLGVLEYLLFGDSPTSACLDTAKINTEGTWTALAQADLAARRAAYARVVADDVAARLEALSRTWGTAEGGFHTELAGAGTTSRWFGSQQVALNAVMDALFYVDTMVKDQKLGKPLGLVSGCVGACTEELEGSASRLGHAHLRANLAAFRALFLGCAEDGSGLAFDDLLEGLGAPSVASDVRAAAGAIDAALAAIPDGKLEDELRGRTDAARNLHAAWKKLVDILRTEVVSVLSLELPARVEGDND